MLYDLVYPDYQRGLVNLACSILKHFGVEPPHGGLRALDRKLRTTKAKNIVVLVCDGLGSEILKRHLPPEAFLRRHMQAEITSVFPPTTTAATAALQSGLYPAEHGWIGFDIYVQAVDRIVGLYRNNIKDTDSPAAPTSVAQRYLGYKSIVDRINQETPFRARSIFPFGPGAYLDLDDRNDQIAAFCAQEGKKYVYAYGVEPDSTMHDWGPSDPAITPLVQQLNDGIEALVRKLKDTLLIVTADHGQIDAQAICLARDYPDVTALLEKGNVGTEGRACSFWVKKGRGEAFIALFQKYFADDFLLLTQEELLAKGWLGAGRFHENLLPSLGDYIAVGIGDRYFRYHEKNSLMRGNHAGLCRAEMMVPVIWVET